MKKLCTILFFLLTFLKLSSQDLLFNQYGPDNGLRNPFIYAMNQDRNAYLWIGTAEGLFRFNGFEFKHYTEKDSLAENFVTTIFREKSGELWVGHSGGGITRISNGSFEIMSKPSGMSSAIIDVDAGDGMIWFATQNEGFLIVHNDRNVRPVKNCLEGEAIQSFIHAGGSFSHWHPEGLFVVEDNEKEGLTALKKKINDFPLSRWLIL